jgi:hypothetical protein
VPASLDLSAPKLGSGARFKKLSTTLASRGAKDPDALAAFIGRRKLGNAGMSRLSQGKSLANDDLGIYLAADAPDSPGKTLTCPSCSYSGPATRFGAGGADVQAKPADLRTPAPSTGGARTGVPLTVKGGAAHALASGTRNAIELATGTVKRPVSGPYDVGVRRGGVIYHRRGGNDIAQIRKNDDGTWTAVVAGKPLAPHQHQRAALMEAVGTYNAAVNASTRQPAPLQPAPQQTELMAEYGIPAMRSAAFATPTAGASDGPRMTTASASTDDGTGGSGGTDANGLNAKGQAIYKKLKAKGFPEARAVQFAKQSQDAKPGAFGKSGS